MKIILTLAALAIAFTTLPTLADEHDEEQVRHYEVAKPTSVKEAAALLNKTLKQIEAAIEAGNAHQVHELSYNSEAALLALKDLAKSSTRAGDFQKLWVVNEQMHEESESETPDMAFVKDKFEKLVIGWKVIKGQL